MRKGWKGRGRGRRCCEDGPWIVYEVETISIVSSPQLFPIEFSQWNRVESSDSPFPKPEEELEEDLEEPESDLDELESLEEEEEEDLDLEDEESVDF